MQMIVNKEMANRMDDSNSITACPRGEPRSDSGRGATVVMGCIKMKQTRKWRDMARQKTIKAGKPALVHVISAGS